LSNSGRRIAAAAKSGDYAAAAAARARTHTFASTLYFQCQFPPSPRDTLDGKKVAGSSKSHSLREGQKENVENKARISLLLFVVKGAATKSSAFYPMAEQAAFCQIHHLRKNDVTAPCITDHSGESMNRSHFFFGTLIFLHIISALIDLEKYLPDSSVSFHVFFAASITLFASPFLTPFRVAKWSKPHFELFL
jgi:hypothetical protein